MIKAISIFREIYNWLLKAWPVWSFIAILLLHQIIHTFFQSNGENVNRVAGSIFQIIGGIIVFFSINENIGTFKRENIFSMVVNWFSSFPLIKKNVTISVDSAVMKMTSGTPHLKIKRKYNSVEENLIELEKQIDECRQLIFEIEKAVMEKIEVVKSKLEGSIVKNQIETQAVKKLLDESVLGTFKLQIFGVLLVIYGAVIPLF
ncbi:MAG: hypothetical protein IMZ60_04170 [Actinobacteria bacterium]|nr:hypothetical protein [Actinomycetota bacterium]